METNNTVDKAYLKKSRIKKNELLAEAEYVLNAVYKIAKKKKVTIDEALIEYIRINEKYLSIDECKEKLENDKYWISCVNYQFFDKNAFKLLDEFTNMLLIKGYEFVTISFFKEYFFNYYNYINRHKN